MQYDKKTLSNILCGLIGFKTVSHDDRALDDTVEFDGFFQYLQRTFFHLFRACRTQRVGNALVIEYKGWTAKPAAAFLTHCDVVDADRKEWSIPPFDGALLNGCVWGRGALDMKGQLLCSLAAADSLIASGFTPQRTLYFVLTGDEETSDARNSGQIADIFRTKGIKLDFVLDEGTACIFSEETFGTRSKLAGICVAEKGFAVAKLLATSEGGHASMPDQHTALGLVAKAIVNIEEHPKPARSGGVMAQFFKEAGIKYDPSRFDKRLNALSGTTIAATMASGSGAHNVLPTQATATLNIRIAPQDTPNGVLTYIRALCPEGVTAEYTYACPPAPVSPTDSEFYMLMTGAVGAVFPDVRPVPMVMLAKTDSSDFTPLCSNVFRFSPFMHYEELMHTIHAANERIPVTDIVDGYRFYRYLIKNS